MNVRSEITSIQPRVSVVMLAYRHERYLEQAVQSVVSQNADFPFELLIGEDCSPDGTRELSQRLAQQHPDRIRLFLNEKNLGALENARRVYNACKGEFIAICEGDDYWSDPNKLRRQVAALDSHPEWCGCFHRTLVIDESGSSEDSYFPITIPPDEVSLDSIAAENCIPTCSVMYRRRIVPVLPEWFSALALADWPMNILYAAYGPFGYLNEVMSVYRRHGSGIWSTLNAATGTDHSLRALFAAEAHSEEPARSKIIAGRREFLRRIISRHDEELVRLRKIESRYRALQLHRISAVGKWFKDLLKR